MADIEYRVDYDDHGLLTSQHILQLGTEDRVRFVTTPQTVKYLEKKKWRLALKRNSDAPFKAKAEDFPDPYVVPVNSDPHWLKVEHQGDSFHWDCGYVDEKGVFYKWPEPALSTRRISPVQPSQPQQVNSIPFPT